MTLAEAPVAASSADSYRAQMDACTDTDRAFAADLSTRVIDVVKAFAAVKHRMYGQAHPDGLDFGLLFKLGKAGPMRASDLAERLCAAPSTVSRQVAALVKADLVERRADPHDGRASILVPTEAGLRKLDELIAMRGRVFAPLLADLSDDERAQFLRYLDSFVTKLTANIDAIKHVASDLIEVDAQSRRNS